MKAAIFILPVLLSALTAAGVGITSVDIDGNTYSNISSVYMSGGRVIINSDSGIAGAILDKVPADFLASWLKPGKVADAQKTAIAEKKAALDHAITAGYFREVGGQVYDIRRPQSGWLTFQSIKVFQVLDDGALLDPDPDNIYSSSVIYVKHLPPIGDTEYISFTGLPSGTYSYVNKNGDSRTVRAFDFGRICSREEIPQSVLNGQKVVDDLPLANSPQRDVLATLPDSDNLVASGSGFFVSTDGYLVTNNHVVKGANLVKVKTAGGVFPATVIRTDSVNDLALVKVDGSFTALAVSTNDVQLGDPVFTIGFPDPKLQGTQPKYTDGKISSLEGIQDDPTEFQISVPVQPGNSGGPLVLDIGNECQLQLAALQRDDAELNERLVNSMRQKQYVRPIFKDIRELLERRAQVFEDWAANCQQSAALCREQAAAVAEIPPMRF